MKVMSLLWYWPPGMHMAEALSAVKMNYRHPLDARKDLRAPATTSNRQIAPRKRVHAGK